MNFKFINSLSKNIVPIVTRPSKERWRLKFEERFKKESEHFV